MDTVKVDKEKVIELIRFYVINCGKYKTLEEQVKAVTEFKSEIGIDN